MTLIEPMTICDVQLIQEGIADIMLFYFWDDGFLQGDTIYSGQPHRSQLDTLSSYSGIPSHM